LKPTLSGRKLGEVSLVSACLLRCFFLLLISKPCSRLSASNNALNIQLVDIQTKSSLNSSSNAPLQYENLRLRSELDALSAHVSWMESELSARTSQLSLVRSTEATNYLSVSNELHSVKSKHEELTASNENLKIKYTSALKRLDSLQKQLMETEKNHSDEIHHLNSELTTERRLVALTKEQAARMEDRYNNVVRDMESMKMLAVAADQDHAIELTRLKEFMEKELQNSLEELKHNSEIEIEELKSELGRVRAEKLKLEDDLIHRSENMKTSPVTDSIQHHWVLEEGGKTDLNDEASVPSGPLSLVALYDRLAAKEDELRSERLDRQRLELYLERIQKDIEMKAPIMRQQRKEYEKALSQKKDLQLRLHEVVEDSRVLRETLRDKERESKQTEKECSELRLENADLATQVQTLLRRIIGDESSADERNNDLLGFVSVDELQTQNQRLLREHHRLVKNVSDLESQLSNDTSQMKILQAESELNQLREEREHQEVLISGIVQQRDLYRALLLKTDAQILAAAGGEIDVGLDKGQTHIQQQKQELESTIAKLNADLISANNARVGLEERLVRIDAYSESLSLSNAKLQRDLSAAHAAAARSDAESSYCKQKLERVEDDLVNTKAELTRVVESRKEFMRINDDLQADLIALKNQVSKSEQELSHNEAKLRLSDAQVKTAQATELRLTNEINSLRLELARQESFIESMQRIETALSSRANESRTQLENEIKRLNDLMSVERSQHQLTVENFLNKISSLEAQVESLQMRREEALSAVTALNKLVSELTDREAVLKKQYDDSQAALNKANVRLGNIEPDSTNGDKFEMITNELNALKDALTASKKKCDDYQIIAQSAEKSLLELSNVSSDYKLHTENEIVRLKEQIEMLNRTVQLKQEALDEIAKDLSVSREAQENTLHELQTKLNQVDLERQSLKDAEICYKDRVGAILFELESSKADARSAKVCFQFTTLELMHHPSRSTSLLLLNRIITNESWPYTVPL
jgi:nucleoprotein TPR